MSVPAEIAGVGSTSQRLRVSPGFDPLKAKVGPEEYFVLSRIDGTQSLKDVLLSTGLPIDRAVAIVTKLRALGALLLPGEVAPPAVTADGTGGVAQPSQAAAAAAAKARAGTSPLGVPLGARTATGHKMPEIPAARTKAPSTPPRPSISLDAPTARLPPHILNAKLDAPTVRKAVEPAPKPAPAPASAGPVPPLDDPTAAELTALAEPGALTQSERVRILALARLAHGRDPWALLGVPAGSDAKTLKRAYFLLSKEIHPDRYYGKQLGTFADRLPLVFEAVSRAYARLTGGEKAGAARAQSQAEQPQTPQEYAAELFDRACALEVGGDPLGAMKLFAAAVRIDAQTRYLRRAASCALAAGQPRSAVEYAKKAQTQAPDDPSAARLLAASFKATGKLADAEEVLVMAMALKSENDVLTAELRNDLADVRRLLQG